MSASSQITWDAKPDTSQLPAPSNGTVVDRNAIQWDSQPDTSAVSQPSQPSALTRFAQGVVNATPLSLLKPPEDANEQIAHAIGGDGALAAYRVARGIVSGVEGLLASKKQNYQQAVSNFHQAIADAKSGKYGTALNDTLNSAGSVAETIMPFSTTSTADEMVKQGASGDVAGALGKGVGAIGSQILNTVAPTLAPEADAATDTAASDTATDTESATETPSISQPGFVQKIIKGKNVEQAPAKQALTAGANASAQDAGVAASANVGEPIRTALDRPIATLAKKEATAYQAINDAAGTDLKSLYDYRTELTDALDDPTNIGNRTSLQAELKTTQSQIDSGEAQAVENGLSPKALDAAKKMTQQRYAMQDLKKKLFNNESVVQGNAAHGVPETVNVDSAIRNVENLDKPSKYAPEGSPSRLEQALGKQGATQLKQGLYAAQKAGKSAVRLRWITGLTAGAAASKLGVGKYLFHILVQ